MLTQNMSGVSYVADHSMRQLQLQAVDTVSLTVRTHSETHSETCFIFFPNNAGLLPALTEAPWKEFGTGESGAD